MARAGGGAVFKSASTGVLRPLGARGGGAADRSADVDPLQAVLNHSWAKSSGPDGDAGSKRLGIASRNRGIMAGLGGLDDKSASSKAADKSKATGTLGQAGGSLFVETTAAKSRAAPTFTEPNKEEDADSPPTSPGDANKSRRGGPKVVAPPSRKYQNDVCPVCEVSPRMRDAPLCRKGQVKLNFEDSAAEGDAEHAQAEVDDHKPHLDKEQEHFVDLVHHFQGAVNQAGVRLNEMLVKIRKHFLEDSKWLEQKVQFDQLTEVSFEVQTANYFLAKWHHHLEPRKLAAPTRPSKIEDMSADDILAQVLYSISRMEVLASKLGPVLEKICHDAKTMRRGPNGEPLTPTSKNALSLAKKRGFTDIEEFNKLMGHLEHILSITQHLSNPPKSGLPEVQKTVVVLLAAAKFKKGLSGKTFGNMAGDVSQAKASAAIGMAAKSLGASIDAKVTDGAEG